MVQKSDGGYGYDTTDLAALRYRANEEKADWIIYVTDEGQKLHFDTVIDAGKQVGYMDPAKTRYDHVGFGLVLQVMAGGEEEGKEESKKPKIGKMKTREGDSTKLMDLHDEARNRTLEIFRQRMKEDEEEGADKKVQVDEAQLEQTAEVMGISAIKYYDLKQSRIQNYVFAYDKMLDPRGNTGVYLLYMYVRVLSILRKGGYEPEALAALVKDAKFTISNKSERELALALLRVPEQIDLALTDLQLNRLTDQLYEIAVKIGEFYQQSKVIGSPEEKSRVLLLEATRRVMHLLFSLLGMKTIERI